MTKRWQYQSLFEPVKFTADVETVTLDKWYLPLSEPVRDRPQPLRTTYSFFTELDLAVEVITLDKWYLPLSEPVRRPRPLNQATYSFFTELDIAAPAPAVATNPIVVFRIGMGISKGLDLS